jgi:hypothetical protein
MRSCRKSKTCGSPAQLGNIAQQASQAELASPSMVLIGECLSKASDYHFVKPVDAALMLRVLGE